MNALQLNNLNVDSFFEPQTTTEQGFLQLQRVEEFKEDFKWGTEQRFFTMTNEGLLYEEFFNRDLVESELYTSHEAAVADCPFYH